jgi:amino acid adenylation domain-containing protein
VRHEPLRTTFGDRAGQPIQLIAPAHICVQALPLSDLSALPAGAQAEETRRLGELEFRRPIDLASGPLVRTHLLRLAEEEHALLLTIHHIATDGWSMGILIDELPTLYQAFLSGAPSPLPALPIQYADYAAWQRASAEGPQMDDQRAYWRTQLADAPTTLELPTDFPRTPRPGANGEVLVFAIEPELYTQLQALGRHEGVTLFMILLAAFQILLARYTGQHDMVLSTPVSGRNRSELEGLIGFFVNTLVIRTSLAGNPSLRTLLQRVRAATLGAFAHQDLPFEQLVEMLQPARNPSRTPFDQVAFVLQNAPMGVLELPGLRLNPLPITNHSTKSELTLFIQEEQSGPRGQLEYSSDLFTARTIRQLADQYLGLLAQIVADPTRPLMDLQILSPGERAHILATACAPARALPGRAVLHALVEAQVDRTPDAVALCLQGEHLSYAACDRQAAHLARRLRAYGVGAEVRVGLCLERSFAQLTALLAILKAGGAYVPLDPQYPAERLLLMLQSAEVALLLTSRALLARLPAYRGAVLCLDDPVEERTEWPEHTLSDGEVQPDTLAALIFTSGSTGQPAGVAIPHQALVNHCLAISEAYQLKASDRVLHFASLSFDVAAEEIFPTWSCGGTVVPRPAHSVPALPDFEALIEQERLSVVNIPAGYWHTWVEALVHQDRRAPRALRQVIVGSERAFTAQLRAWETVSEAGLRLINAYGPTETTITATLYRPVDGRHPELPVLPIGRPIANTQAYVLDEALQPLPVGVSGSLYIAGAGLARGYLHLPARTAECFLPHPHSTEPGQRLYRTGDRARFLADGTIEFLGRQDRQVKVRGFRVEPGEIEETLREHPLVQDVVVSAQSEEDGQTRLLAYVVVDQARQAGQSGQHAEQVARWQALYNKIYGQLSLQGDPTGNFAGWDSTITGQPIPQEEMWLWAQHTSERILRTRPQRILEIGCGAGLFLWRLAPRCAHYHASDFSRQALQYLQAIRERPAYRALSITLEQREADDFSGLADQDYDLVILNSVIQYFPGVNYLLRVLEGAMRVVRPGGHIFLGDVRHLHLLRTFHCAVQRFQAEPGLPLEQLRQRVQQRVQHDPELLLDPTFFTALQQHLPRIVHVQVEPRRGLACNELTLFRYDVTLTLDRPGRLLRPSSWQPWGQEIRSLDDLRARLQAGAELLALSAVSNARLQEENRALELLDHAAGVHTAGELHTLLANDLPGQQACEIEELYQLAAAQGYEIEVSWLCSGADGSYDVAFSRQEPGETGMVAFPRRSERPLAWGAYASNPLQGQLATRVVPLLQTFLQERLPLSLQPSAFLLLPALPRLPGGKIDYRALPAPQSGRPELSTPYVSPRSASERTIAAVWQEVLHLEKVGTQDTFFELGGHSLLLVQVHSRLSAILPQPLSIVDLFAYPTIAALAAHLQKEQAPRARPVELHPTHSGREIAIIGLAGRFPQAADIEQFWRNIADGVESIEFFTAREMIAFGVPSQIALDPTYVPAVSRLADVELFDADFFGYSPREAELIDPQQRVFLECAWEALENAGYVPETYPGAIGVYAGSSINTYFLFNVVPNQEVLARVGFYQAILGNEAAFLTTRASHRLNLRGPSVNVNTACSTSLVATHMACQSLLQGECDLALAGGVTIGVPQETGHTYVQGMITSPDGHCRAFDARAQGTVGGNGIGLVVLKRLEEALRDGDSIVAVIKGTAINNDGADKVGFTAPSVHGQASVISAALARAGVHPESIGYVEAHGTGTLLGDPIEVAALTRAYRQQTEACGYCALGSVKSNIGHLDNAAGVAGLIKAAMALHTRQIPPTLHITAPNPHIDFASSPFYLNTTLTPWTTQGQVRRAAVSSFGIGGTNAHAILEEAPPHSSLPASRPWQMLVLSARTPTALRAATSRLATHLQAHPEVNLADVAYTSQVGRTAFPWRRILVCRTYEDALSGLNAPDGAHGYSAQAQASAPPLAFLFPGQGTQYAGMGQELYHSEPVFRTQIDRCTRILLAAGGPDLQQLLSPPPGEQDATRLRQTGHAQLALFAVEYALATLWQQRGVQPQAMLGHSIGEYVAACLAGVFSLEEALPLVAARGRLMQQLPPGSMLSIPLASTEVEPLLSDGLALAAINGPAQCVAAGTTPAIADLQARLAAQQVTGQMLHTSHAFHSPMVEAIMQAFLAEVRRIPLRAPAIPYLSNVTGTWISAAEATSPTYWVRHLRQTVRFSASARLLLDAGFACLEVGPGHTLGTLLRQHQQAGSAHLILSSLPSSSRARQAGESEVLLTTSGRLWLAGFPLAWPQLYTHERRLRIPLPGYPFERQRYWLAPPGAVRDQEAEQPRPAPPVSSPPSAAEEEDELEATVRVIWHELLGREQIGRHDDFFELGGHSLMATQLVARLRATFPVEIPLERFFAAPTIAALARVIEDLLLIQIEALSEEEAHRLREQ